jgi:dipeptidase
MDITMPPNLCSLLTHRQPIFQKIFPGPAAVDALWAAQRVPDGSIAAVTNAFTIREIDFEDKDNFITSEGLKEAALPEGWWVEGTSFDFTLVFAGGSGPQYNQGRRMWRIYSLLAPESSFPQDYDDYIIDAPYPATVVSRNISRDQVFGVMRDFYSGTPYALNSGMGGGYGGTPERWQAASDADNVTGSWERSISIYRSEVSLVNQLREGLDAGIGGLVWFTSGAAHGGTYIPLAIGMSALPGCVTTETSWGSLEHWSVAWATRFILQVLQLRFDQAYATFSATRDAFEEATFALVSDLETRYTNGDADLLNDELGANAEGSVTWLWLQSDAIVVSVANNPWGYPAWWLESPEVGYTNGPS